jgi:hypothetical protein
LPPHPALLRRLQVSGFSKTPIEGLPVTAGLFVCCDVGLALHVATFAFMKTVSIRDAKNRLTELAREVEEWRDHCHDARRPAVLISCRIKSAAV